MNTPYQVEPPSVVLGGDDPSSKSEGKTDTADVCFLMLTGRRENENCHN